MESRWTCAACARTTLVATHPDGSPPADAPSPTRRTRRKKYQDNLPDQLRQRAERALRRVLRSACTGRARGAHLPGDNRTPSRRTSGTGDLADQAVYRTCCSCRAFTGRPAVRAGQAPSRSPTRTSPGAPANRRSSTSPPSRRARRRGQAEPVRETLRHPARVAAARRRACSPSGHLAARWRRPGVSTPASSSTSTSVRRAARST